MWRLKALTEQFGPCGLGWKYEIVRREMTPGAKNEIAAFVEINLYYKLDSEWSAPIPGSGGSMFVTNEKNGAYTSDECYKMALTDAISVACKALGIGADVYWDADSTKYQRQKPTKPEPLMCAECGQEIKVIKNRGKIYAPETIAENTMSTYGRFLCWECSSRERERLKAEDVGDIP